jgi:hypothetical protein
VFPWGWRCGPGRTFVKAPVKVDGTHVDTCSVTTIDALRSVEDLLRRIFGRCSGKDHYRTAPLGRGRTLGVDIFGGSNTEGHVRVHVFNVSEAEARIVPSGGEPVVPGLHGDQCTKCDGVPFVYPSSYHGPRQDGEREYFGFQWHARPEVNSDDLEHVEAAVRWLAERFRRDS